MTGNSGLSVFDPEKELTVRSDRKQSKFSPCIARVSFIATSFMFIHVSPLSNVNKQPEYISRKLASNGGRGCGFV